MVKLAWKPLEYRTVIRTAEYNVPLLLYLRRLERTGEKERDEEKNKQDLWTWRVEDPLGKLTTPAWMDAKEGEGRAEMAMLAWVESFGIPVYMYEPNWEPYNSEPITEFNTDWDEDDEAEQAWIASKANKMALD